MIEVEVKGRITESEQMDRVCTLVSDWEALPEETQVDVYFSHPCRDFARTDEALRLRRIGDEFFLTYKGPKLDAVSKTREEIELKISPRMTVVLERLGFIEVARITKRRRPFRKENVLLCIDEVEGIGTFLEIESLSHERRATRDLLRLLNSLGLRSERRSYLELLLEAS